MLIQTLCPFLAGLFVFLLLSCNSLYVFWILSFYQLNYLQIFFSHSMVVFHFLIVSSGAQRFLILMTSNLSIFPSVACTSGFTPKKTIAKSKVMKITVVQEYTTKQNSEYPCNKRLLNAIVA